MCNRMYKGIVKDLIAGNIIYQSHPAETWTEAKSLAKGWASRLEKNRPVDVFVILENIKRRKV